MHRCLFMECKKRKESKYTDKRAVLVMSNDYLKSIYKGKMMRKGTLFSLSSTCTTVYPPHHLVKQ